MDESLLEEGPETVLHSTCPECKNKISINGENDPKHLPGPKEFQFSSDSEEEEGLRGLRVQKEW